MPTRQLYWNTDGKQLMYLTAGIAIVICLFGVFNKLNIWRQGRRTPKGARQPWGVFGLLVKIFQHDKRIFLSSSRRNMHLQIFLGFLILLIGTTVIAVQADFGIPIFQGDFYLVLSLLMDCAGVLALSGIIIAAKKKLRKKKQDQEITVDDVVLFCLVVAIILSGFCLEGLRIYVLKDPWAVWSPIGWVLAQIFWLCGFSVGISGAVHRVLWYVHMFLSLGLIAYLPYSKLFHLLAMPLNLLFQSGKNQGVLAPFDAPGQGEEVVGANSLVALSRKQLLELDACIGCGRCQKHCPVYTSEGSSSPQKQIKELKQLRSPFLRRGEATNPVHSEPAKDFLWACTTCGLCENKCPARINHVQRIVDLRRSLVKKQDCVPLPAQIAFSRITEQGRPVDAEESAWAEVDVNSRLNAPLIDSGKETDVLYWVGCSGSSEKRNFPVAQAMVKILTQAKIDFAVLGGEEKCCGHSVRRLGNEQLFQQLALDNIHTLKKYRFNRIVTHCPHCYHTLKNEYPQLGAEFNIVHHAQFLEELIESGKITLHFTNAGKVVFQDPCYLGRANNIYQAPRNVLGAVPGLELLEMKDSRSMSTCCGAGGGRLLLDSEAANALSLQRAKEALKLEPDIIATACSACLQGLTAAVTKLGSSVGNMDLAEIIAEHLQTDDN